MLRLSLVVNFKLRLIFVCGVNAAFSLPSLGVIIANYSDETNLRFADDPLFIGSAFDLSGVGRGSTRWATAIGPNYFLSANHFRPAAGSSVTFVDGNSLASPSFTYTVGGGFRVGSTDLWVGYTHLEIDPAIARYSYATQDADNLADLGLGDETLYLNGRRSSGATNSVTASVLGTNQAESFYEGGSEILPVPGGTVEIEVPGGFENDMIVLFENLPGDDNAPLFHESLVQGGDSGSPLLRFSGGELIILGVGSLLGTEIPGNFIDTAGEIDTAEDPIELRSGSFYSYTGSYTSEIEAAIAQVPSPVPEPGVFFLAVLLPLPCLIRQR